MDFRPKQYALASRQLWTDEKLMPKACSNMLSKSTICINFDNNSVCTLRGMDSNINKLKLQKNVQDARNNK